MSDWLLAGLPSHCSIGAIVDMRLQAKSGAKRTHSKTWRKFGPPDEARERHGVRALCAAFEATSATISVALRSILAVEDVRVLN
jgi:hypothetical protein